MRASALYEGTVRHRRFRPVTHEFTYRTCLAYLDLAELDDLFRGRWLWSARRPNLAWLRRADYLGPEELPLDEAVRARVEAATGRRPLGPVRMLAHLRTFGHCFNPVALYHCFGADGRLETLLAEITNTPWGERHAYVLGRDRDEGPGGRRHRWRFEKQFHVSPFLDIGLGYDWRYVEPGRELIAHFSVLERGESAMDATLVLRRREIDGGSLARSLALYPAMTAQVVAAIYWQALRLRLKGAPFFVHPAKRARAGAGP